MLTNREPVEMVLLSVEDHEEGIVPGDRGRREKQNCMNEDNNSKSKDNDKQQ